MHLRAVPAAPRLASSVQGREALPVRAMQAAKAAAKARVGAAITSDPMRSRTWANLRKLTPDTTEPEEWR